MTSPNIGNAPGDGSLRLNGQSIASASSDGANLPSTCSKRAEAQEPAVRIMRDCVAGNARIRSQGSTYLPQAPGEDHRNYAARLNRSVFFNVTGRTVQGLVGQVFRKDPVLSEAVPVQIAGVKDEKGTITQEGHWENIDLAGTHGDVFLRDCLADAITTGHAGILVEFAATDGTQTAADEQTRMRPYWLLVHKDNIVSWRTDTVDGQTILRQVVLKECTMVPDGAFGEKEQTRYRVLWRDDTQAVPVGWTLLEITEDKQVAFIDGGFYRNQDEIPLAEIVTSGRKAIFDSTPPLLDMAYLNLAHYQQWSDYANSLHKTCVPIFFAAGFEQEGELVLGPNTALITSNPAAKAEYVSHSGESLASCKAALDDLKADMGTLGIQMLTPQKRSAETATAHRLDKSTEDSALAVTARGLQDATERALGFHAKYMRLPSGGSCEINREFDEPSMQADMLTAWTGAVANAGVPARFMLNDMQQKNLIPADENVGDIADEMAANQAATAEADAQRQKDLLAMKQQQPQVMPVKTAAA